ncbi:hypothetical protein HPB51_013270 [Rhipicephalus microplus]|uniref:Uncharacterized protein n=1 Tax=Rhipicephalus microplus TaxID=6941 RepID=A0A9J6EA79_RHIMP|nr:hypothetical protein HPB51_013270 [Rhipicephalus microplus]
MDAGGHPSAKEPKVYSFVSLKGTVMEVDLSAAIVEVREGPSVRELTITVDNFYNEGRPYLNNLTRVLRKGAIINVDYMVGRVGGEDFVHCDVAWLGPKPKGAPRLTEEEFRQQLCGRGSTLELNNLFKDAQRGPAVGNHHKSMEMYRQSPQEEMYKRIVEMTKEEVWAQICAEIKDALQDWQKQVSENAPTSQGQGDDGTAVGTTEWQPRSGSCPNVSQKPDVAAASSRPLETFLDAAVRKREVKPPPGFHIPPSSALVERKPEPVSIASARQTSNILHQPGASWCASTSQFEGHPQASSNINATSVVLAESPVAAIHSSWHFSNVPQQPGVAAASSPARVSQQTWLGGGQPSSFEMRQDVSPFQGHGSNQKDVQDFGIAFDDSLVEGEELSEDDIRRLGLLDP